jgi:hypothetical protein
MLRKLTLSMASLLALVASSGETQADGIPEPDLVIYGVVQNTATGNRLTFGSITWSFQPAIGGPAIVANGVLTNINDQFCYVLHVPCETDLPGFAISTTSLRLASSPLTYRRGTVSISGATATFVNPAQTNLVLARTDRGRIERIDLIINDPNLNGMPEAWQLQYFGFTGVDPNGDPDGDGLTNLEEFKAGTSPIDGQSRFALITVQPDVMGGLRVDWESATGKFYILQRSPQLLSGFSNVATHIPATAPQNSYRDASATGEGPYFYRLRVEE